MSQENKECFFCRTSSPDSWCKICTIIIGIILFGMFPILFLILIIQAIFHLSENTVTRIIFTTWPTIVCSGIIAIVFRTIRGRGLIGGTAKMGRLLFRGLLVIFIAEAIGFAIFLSINLLDKHEQAIASEFSLKFKDLVLVASRYTAETSDKSLVYPAHSLVVYRPDASGERADEEQCSYHYGCPKKWLATTKEEVKLVVLVSRGNEEATGRYEPTGVTAFKQNWNVVFVDLATQRIVARALITEYDPKVVSAMNMFDRNHSSLPMKSEVVSAIQNIVSFAQ